MDVVLLGTGAADGWPNPFCRCASCAAAGAAGLVRGQTAALVDRVLLLDCGPDAARAAARAGRDLAGVRHVLLTHAHPDHVEPAAVLWRHWAGRPEPLDLVGPPAALAAYDDWLAPDDPVTRRSVGPGDRVRLGEYDVRVVAATHEGPEVGPAVLYDVTGPAGARLLWATDTGPLSDAALEAVAGAAYDLLLLEETMGDATAHGTDHHDLVTFPRELVRLREAGALTDRTDLVAVHLGHHNPAPAELDRRLAAWGARTVPDGTTLTVRPDAPRHSPSGQSRTRRAARRVRDSPLGGRRGRRVLVLGGARSGKSLEAERRLAAADGVTYVATSPPVDAASGPGADPEWAARVAAHRARRPAGWTTVETVDVAGVLATADGPVLVDCLSLWLAARLDAAGVWDGGPLDPVHAAVDELVAAWRAYAGQGVVAVSNEVGSGVVPATASGRLYRDELGRLNARLAAESDEVVLMVAGLAVPLKVLPRVAIPPQGSP